jgi:hypothetical protein
LNPIASDKIMVRNPAIRQTSVQIISELAVEKTAVDDLNFLTVSAGNGGNEKSKNEHARAVQGGAQK